MMFEFQEMLGSILLEISEEHNIDLKVLEEKYLTGEGALEVPEKKVKKVVAKKKAESDEEGRAKCEAKTAKGMPCKNNALSGMKFCQCHNKDKGKAPAKATKKKTGSGSESEGEIEAPPAPRKAALKKVAQKHSHDRVSGEQENCEMCDTLGNPEVGECSSNPKVDANVQKQLDDIFAKMDQADESDSESESDSEDELNEGEKQMVSELFGADD